MKIEISVYAGSLTPYEHILPITFLFIPPLFFPRSASLVLTILSAFRSVFRSICCQMARPGAPVGRHREASCWNQVGWSIQEWFNDSLEWICAFSYVFGAMCVFNANAYVWVRSGGTVPPQEVSIDACALPEYKISSKSRLWKIRDRDMDFHQNVGSRWFSGFRQRIG